MLQADSISSLGSIPFHSIPHTHTFAQVRRTAISLPPLHSAFRFFFSSVSRRLSVASADVTFVRDKRREKAAGFLSSPPVAVPFRPRKGRAAYSWPSVPPLVAFLFDSKAKANCCSKIKHLSARLAPTDGLTPFVSSRSLRSLPPTPQPPRKLGRQRRSLLSLPNQQSRQTDTAGLRKQADRRSVEMAESCLTERKLPKKMSLYAAHGHVS